MDESNKQLSNLVFVDCEADGPAPPPLGRLTEFGAVLYADFAKTFHGCLPGSKHGPPEEPAEVFRRFRGWLKENVRGRPVFVSDNVAYDWQFINHGFHLYVGENPFGYSGRRISDFYAGLTGDFRNTQRWKRLRVTTHDHHPVHDALGNAEAFKRIIAGERGL